MSVIGISIYCFLTAKYFYRASSWRRTSLDSC